MKDVNKIKLIFNIVGIIALVTLIGYNSNDMFSKGRHAQLQDMRMVYAICHTAGKECQEAQERTSTEYLCNDSQRRCWVEVK